MNVGIIGLNSEYFSVHNEANETFGSEAIKNSLNGSSSSPLKYELRKKRLSLIHILLLLRSNDAASGTMAFPSF